MCILQLLTDYMGRGFLSLLISTYRWMDSSRNRPDAMCASPPQQKGKQIRDSTAFSGCRAKPKRARKGTRH